MTYLQMLHTQHLERRARFIHAGAAFLATHPQPQEPPRALPMPIPVPPTIKRPALFVTTADDRISMGVIINQVAAHFELPVSVMLSRTRKKKISRPRQVAMYLCCHLSGGSLPRIGKRLGGYDHTTIIHARTVIGKMAATDPVMAEHIEQIRRKICDIEYEAKVKKIKTHITGTGMASDHG